MNHIWRLTFSNKLFIVIHWNLAITDVVSIQTTNVSSLKLLELLIVCLHIFYELLFLLIWNQHLVLLIELTNAYFSFSGNSFLDDFLLLELDLLFKLNDTLAHLSLISLSQLSLHFILFSLLIERLLKILSLGTFAHGLPFILHHS